MNLHRVIHSFSALAMALLISGPAFDAKAFQCIDLFRSAPISKLELAQGLTKSGLENSAYVARWQVKDPAQAGPYPVSGETLVTGVPHAKLQDWMKEVGTRTIGFMVNGLPQMGPGTGTLRLGEEYYSFQDIQNGEQPHPFEDVLQGHTHGYTEATFSVTPSEMAAIKEFIRARGNQEVIAKKNIRGGAKKGEPIRPEFDEQKFTLALESCAAACISFADPKWFQHYDGKALETLQFLQQRLDLRATFVAKQFIWGNARNPNLGSLTLFGIDVPAREIPLIRNGEIKRVKPLDLTTNFMRDNNWFNLRGMPVYGFIPDSRDGETGTIRSKRVPLNEWIADQDR